MATSEAEIANLAIRHLGISKEISNFTTDQTETASACRAFYTTVRDALLRDHHWEFAKTYATLTGKVSDPNDEWGYSYIYPSDCLQVRKIISGLRAETQDQKIPFAIASGASSLLILTDENEAKLIYTKRETDVSRFPTDFALALSFRLALYIAPTITAGDPFRLRESVGQMYLVEVAQAQARGAIEVTEDRQPEAEWIAGR